MSRTKQVSENRTYFGLEIVRDKFVRESDIAVLPFYEFWSESSIGSAFIVDPETKDNLVYLHDWEAFSCLFIQTGRHRWMAVGSSNQSKRKPEPTM